MVVELMRPRPPVETVEKSWGREIWIVNNDRYCGKFLYFRANSIGSLHFHAEKHETFYVRDGHVQIEVADCVYDLRPGEAIELPAGTPHRVKALIDSEIIEFSTPHVDSDTYRIINSP